MNLTTLDRSATHGKWRAFSVREPLRLSRGDLTDDVLVFTLFLLVSTLLSRRHIRFNCHLDQVPSGTVPGVGNCR